MFDSLNTKLNEAIDKDGIKVNVGFDNQDILLLGVTIFVAVVLAGITINLLTRAR